MKQYIFGSSGGNISQNVDLAMVFMGAGNFVGGTSSECHVCPTDGIVRNVHFYSGFGLPSNSSRAFHFQVNGSTVDSVILNQGQSYGHLDGPYNLYAGDTLGIFLDQTGFPGSSTQNFSMLFEGDVENESLLLSMVRGSSATLGNYHPLVSYQVSGSTSENGVYSIIPTSGTLKKLYIQTSNSSWGNNPDGYKITLYKNSAPTALTCTVTAPATTANNTSDSVTVAAGDKVSYYVEPLNGPVTAVTMYVGIVFLADTHGESLILGQTSSSTTLFASGTRYTELLAPAPNTLSAGDTAYYSYPNGGAVSLRNFYVELSSSPYVNDVVNDWYKFTVRQQSVDTPMTITIADNGTGNKVGSYTASEIRAAPGKKLTMSVIPNSTPASVYAGWGCVQYVKDYPTTPQIPSFIWPL